MTSFPQLNEQYKFLYESVNLPIETVIELEKNSLNFEDEGYNLEGAVEYGDKILQRVDTIGGIEVQLVDGTYICNKEDFEQILMDFSSSYLLKRFDDEILEQYFDRNRWDEDVKNGGVCQEVVLKSANVYKYEFVNEYVLFRM